MALLVNLLRAVASVGFFGVLVIHIAALLGSATPFQNFERFMFPVLLIVWLPTIFCMNRMTRDFKQKDLWKAALRGCPKWMRITLWTVCGYSWLMALSPLLVHGRDDSQLAGARSLSGVMLGFYAIAVGVLYSSTQTALIDEGRLCLNGHRVGPLAKFCDECGAPVATNPTKPS